MNRLVVVLLLLVTAVLAAASPAGAATRTYTMRSEAFQVDGFETVVPKVDINVLIPALKDAGASDLLELPLSKIVH